MKKSLIKRSANESGFTIIELILVLSIVVIMTAIIIPVGGKWVRETSEKEAIDSLVATIYSIQSYAMAHGVFTQLIFSEDDGRTIYRASAPGKVELSKKALPVGMRVADSSGLKVIEFHANGDIINFGKLTLIGKSGRTHITFQFQRGRMIISESKRTFMARSHLNAWSPRRYFWHVTSASN